MSDKFILQALKALESSGMALDANETVFLERELTQLRVKAFEVRSEGLFARQFVPQATDIAASASQYAYKVWSQEGKAKIGGNSADDAPRIDLKAREVLGKIYPVTASWGWELSELREAIRQGIPLSDQLAKNARSAIDRGIDEMLAFGYTAQPGETNVTTTGLLNNAAVVSNGIAALTNFTGASDPDLMLAALNAMVTPIVTASKQEFIPDTILIDTTHYGVISTTKVGVDNDVTVLRSFLANNPYIKNVHQWYRCNGLGTNTTGRALAYKKDPEILESVIPQEFEQLPPQARNFEFVVNCHARCGGVKVYQPLAMKYGDFAA